MALGGGTFLTQNKILGGSYINFVSKPVPTATLLDRGIVAFAFEFDWGIDGKIFEVVEGDLLKNSLEIFGYDYSSPKLMGLRELFKHATKLYAYKLNSDGVKASNTYATAKCGGVRGNDLKVVIAMDVDNEELYNVSLYLEKRLLDNQVVASSAELVDNKWVEWQKSVQLEVTAGTPLANGTNGEIETANHQTFLDLLESYPDVNAVGYAGTDSTIKALYVAWAKNMRDKVGVKLQAVVYASPADNEAVVNVKNRAELVYWATGVIGGTAVNKSATNLKYDGELEIDTNFKQSDLEKCIKNGEWVLHKVGNEIHVLEDINSLTTVSVDKGEVFKDNQTIRVIDQIATAVANVFNGKYLGKVPNNKDGRLSLWSDIVKVHTDLQNIDALENFVDTDITVEQGDAKKSVVVNEAITVVNTMVRLYMTVVVG